MNILVTGIAGFIGFHLASKLSEKHQVVGVDNFNDYYSVQLKKDRAKILTKKDITIYEEDINNTDKLKEIIQKHKITHIVHLAAQAGVRYSFDHPHEYVHSNISGFLSILEALKTYPMPLIFASSSSVYGTNDTKIFSTKDLTDFPSNFYGATKKANELMAYSYHHLYQIPMVGLRFFTVYGPFGRPDMAYFSFANKIMQEETIDVYNHGKMQRDFTYIDDIVNGIIASIDYAHGFDIFNLGNNSPVSLMKFIETLENSLGKKAKKNFLPMQQGEMVTTFADIEESQKKLNYHPKTSIQEGLEKFANWHQSYFNKNEMLCK
ncbi:MAG TPA: GDP-mannose 4,6-dehydratase [Chlamydiales bacterium]|nr:GDP-mannose 4,6-dehydratase [Chlamydiales bacterium]